MSSSTPIDPDTPPLPMPDPEPDQERDPHASRRRRGCGCLILGLLLLLGAAGWWWFGRKSEKPQEPPVPEVPVVPVTVKRQDMPIYLDGLGTVQPYQSVTLQVRVEGQITQMHFKEGDDVKKGDLLVEIDPKTYDAQLAQAKARVEQDGAQLDNAKRDLLRYADMYERKVIAQQQYDTQVALVDQLSAAVNASLAAVENQKVQLGYTRIHAPISGRIGLRLIDLGNIARPSDQNGIITINQLRPISIVFTLPERHLFAVQQQQARHPLTVYALDRDLAEKPISTGRLTVIDNQIDTDTGTIRMKAEFENSDLRLWPGQFTNARLLLETRNDAIVVPAAVVQRGPEGNHAFVVREDQTVSVRKIDVEMIQLGQAIIRSGLNPGEQVVLEGQYRLQEGTRVRVVSETQPGKVK